MFYSWFFAIFFRKTSKFSFWVLAVKWKHFRDFLGISWFAKTLSPIIWQLVRQLVHSLSSDNKLVVKRNCAKKWKSLRIFSSRLRFLIEYSVGTGHCFWIILRYLKQKNTLMVSTGNTYISLTDSRTK